MFTIAIVLMDIPLTAFGFFCCDGLSLAGIR